MQKRLKLSDYIRRAIADAPVSRYRMSKELGIPQSALSLFMSSKGGLSQERLDILGDYLGLEIVEIQPKVKGSKVKHGKRGE